MATRATWRYCNNSYILRIEDPLGQCLDGRKRLNTLKRLANSPRLRPWGLLGRGFQGPEYDCRRDCRLKTRFRGVQNTILDEAVDSKRGSGVQKRDYTVKYGLNTFKTAELRKNAIKDAEIHVNLLKYNEIRSNTLHYARIR